MAQPAQTLTTDPSLSAAARILARAEGQQDGWIRVEQAAGFQNGVGVEDGPSLRWAERIESLLRGRPDLRVVVDGTAE